MIYVSNNVFINTHYKYDHCNTVHNTYIAWVNYKLLKITAICRSKSIFAYGYFSFCLISCNMDILKNRIDIFSVETSFCQFSNMASSGLKKMFIMQYYIHKNVYQKMFSKITFFLFHNGRCYAIC